MVAPTGSSARRSAPTTSSPRYSRPAGGRKPPEPRKDGPLLDSTVTLDREAVIDPDASPSHESPGGAPAPGADVNDSARIRVLIVDDHAVVRMGLKMFFDHQDDIEVVGEAADGS